MFCVTPPKHYQLIEKLDDQLSGKETVEEALELVQARLDACPWYKTCEQAEKTAEVAYQRLNALAEMITKHVEDGTAEPQHRLDLFCAESEYAQCQMAEWELRRKLYSDPLYTHLIELQRIQHKKKTKAEEEEKKEETEEEKEG